MFVTKMCTFGTFVSWSGAESTVTNVSFIDSAGAHETIWKIGTGGVLVAIVCSQCTFVDWDGASVTIADVSVLADAIVPGGLVDAVGELVTSVGTIGTFVDFWIAFFSISIETIVTNTVISADFAAVGGLLGSTGGVIVAAVVTGGTVVWFVTGVGTEGFKVWEEFVIPAIVTFKLNLGNNIFE